jgi:hypothetical protein
MEEPSLTLATTSRHHSAVSPGATIFGRSVPIGTSSNAPSDYTRLISSSPAASAAQIPSLPLSDSVNIRDHADTASHVSSSELLPNSPEALHRKVGLLLYTSRMLLPFTVPQEALLFHHYMEALAALVVPCSFPDRPYSRYEICF